MNCAMGGKDGEFLALYTNHRSDAIRRTVDSNPVSVACMEYVENGNAYSGTVKGLLSQLSTFSMSMERGDYWPKSPRGLGDSLRRVAPALRQIGIHVSVDAKPRRDGVHCELRPANDGTYTPPAKAPSRKQKVR